jgi:hypothetical protein
MSLRTLLKRDIAKAKHAIADNEHAIDIWKHQLSIEMIDKGSLSIPLPRQGIDYAYGTPDLGRLKAAGNTFVCRYLGGNPDKDLTSSEAAWLSHAGFDIVVVFERFVDDALSGATGGAVDARAVQEQLSKIGAPHAPVYFAVDFETIPEQMPNIRAYFKALTKQLGRDRVGVYGGYAVVHELMSLDNIKYGWQTLAWSDGRWSPHAQLRQVAIEQHEFGIVCDLDRALAADFGQFRRV